MKAQINLIAIGFYLLFYSPAAWSQSSLAEREILSAPASVDFAFSVQFGSLAYKNYDAGNGKDLGGRVNGFRVAAEWIFLQSIGKTSLGMGFGYFRRPNIETGTDQFTSFQSIPLDFYLSYRLDTAPLQTLVPYVQVGPGVSFVKHSSKTGGRTSEYIGNTQLNYAIGLQVLLNELEWTATKSLRNSVGIENSYLIVEYVGSKRIGSKALPQLEPNGVRIGLRFEL